MKINVAAHTYGITTKELLTELKAKFPGLKFTPNTELPEGFERTVQEQAQEYAEVSDTTQPETTGDITQADEDPLVEPKVTEAFHYGVLETISHMRSEDFVVNGQLSALEDIQTFYTSYNEMWALFHQGEVTQQRLKNQALSERLHTITQTKKRLGKQLGERQQVQVSVTNTLQRLKDKLASFLL